MSLNVGSFLCLSTRNVPLRKYEIVGQTDTQWKAKWVDSKIANIVRLRKSDLRVLGQPGTKVSLWTEDNETELNRITIEFKFQQARNRLTRFADKTIGDYSNESLTLITDAIDSFLNRGETPCSTKFLP